MCVCESAYLCEFVCTAILCEWGRAKQRFRALDARLVGNPRHTELSRRRSSSSNTCATSSTSAFTLRKSPSAMWRRAHIYSESLTRAGRLLTCPSKDAESSELANAWSGQQLRQELALLEARARLDAACLYAGFMTVREILETFSAALAHTLFTRFVCVMYLAYAFERSFNCAIVIID